MKEFVFFFVLIFSGNLFAAEMFSKEDILAAKDFGFDAYIAQKSINSKLQRLKNVSGFEAAKEVNAFFNRTFRYEKDSTFYGKDEHWASPQEFAVNGGGDCEDFAIIKHMALKKLGIKSFLAYTPPSKEGAEGHISVVALINGKAFLLDINSSIKPVRKKSLEVLQIAESSEFFQKKGVLWALP